MDNTIWAAFIAAIAALVASLVNFAATCLSIWTTGRRQREGLYFAAIDNATASIQRLKDEVLLILNAVEGSLDAKEAQERLSSARDDLFESYEQFHGKLNPSDRHVFYRAKDLALHLFNTLSSKIAKCRDPGRLPEEEIQKVLWIRSELTDCQNQLRDSKDKLASNR